MTREELEDKMKDLPNPPMRVHLIQQVYDIMNEENERLKKQTEWHYDEPTESENNFYVILKNDRGKIAQKAFSHVSKWPFIQNIHENSCIFYKYSFYVLP